jgi:hypothetical protein
MSSIRNLCIVGAALMILPFPSLDQSAKLMAPEEAITTQVLAKATDTFADMRNFCQHQPQLCERASSLATRVEERTRYGIGLIADWANETAVTTRTALNDYQAFADTIITGSVAPAAATAEVPELRGTIVE